MSLSGKVEDLPLLEILQVVAFCQKTGHLTVRAPEGEAAVVFRDGRVVAGFVWDVPPLGRDDLPPDVREDTIRRRITSILERLVRLREGRFGFSVSGEAPTTVGGRDLAAETLEDGINPEGLMLDLARQMDEDRRDTAAALGASFVAPSEPDTAAEEEALEELVLEEDETSGPLVLLVDDEPDVRRFVGERLAASGFEVVTAADVAAARKAATGLGAEGRRFLLVSDLGLPSLGGHTFRGGFDVVRHVSSLEPRPRVLLMVDRADEKLRARARRLGVSFLTFKPGLSKLDPLQYAADLRAFGDRLARDVLPRLLRRTVTASPAPHPPLPVGDAAARAAALQSALDELARQPEPDVVAFLLLRAARAFLPRAILFLVKDDRLQGLAGFGETAAGQSLDLLARSLSVGLEEASPFADAVARGRSWSGAAPQTGPVSLLLGQIGAFDATSAAVVPVRAHQQTVAVLYGDGADGRPLPDLAGLVQFAERAGRVLDEGFLARRSADTAA